MLCFAGQNVSRKKDGEACQADGCETVSAMLGSWSERPRIGTACSGWIFALWIFKIWATLARKLRFHICYFHSLREVSHDSFVLTSSTFTFWGKSCTTALFPHLPLSLFEGSLARKLRLHIFIYTSSTLTFWGKSRAKPSFSYLPLSLFEGSLAWKAFLRDSRLDARNAVFCRTERVSEEGRGSLSGGRVRDGVGYVRIMVGWAPHWNCEFRLHFHNLNFQNLREVSHENSVSYLPLSDVEGSLARKLRFHFDSSTFRFEGSLALKLRFHTFNFPILREVLHDSFVLTFSTFTFWGKSCTTALFPHLPLSLFEGSLARQLRFHMFRYQILIWRKSRTKASRSHLQLSLFEGSLALELRFHIFHFHFWRILREVSHDSFVFISSTFTFGGKSRAKCVCERE